MNVLFGTTMPAMSLGEIGDLYVNTSTKAIYSKTDYSTWLLHGAFNQFASITDQKPQNTDGGDCNSGSWQTRDLNTLVDPSNIVISLSTNQFTLAPGTYVVRGSAPATAVTRHQAAIYSVTASAIVIHGTSEFESTSYPHNTRSIINGIITPTIQTTYELQHQSLSSQPGNGFGVAATFGTEVYSELMIIKIA